MKRIYFIIGSVFLLIGMVQAPTTVKAANQTTIDLVIPEEESMTEIDRQPPNEQLPDTKSNSAQTGGSLAANQSYLPRTNDLIKNGMSLLGISLVFLSFLIRCFLNKRKSLKERG